jgi:MtN3 and saliva related transmembrane protein
MQWEELMGYAAGALTTFAVVPQISKAWKTRAVDDISLVTVVTLICGLSLWTAYGVVHQTWPIVVTNGIAVLLNGLLLFLVFYEKRNAGKR